jgi:hypothetical protein
MHTKSRQKYVVVATPSTTAVRVVNAQIGQFTVKCANTVRRRRSSSVLQATTQWTHQQKSAYSM